MPGEVVSIVIPAGTVVGVVGLQGGTTVSFPASPPISLEPGESLGEVSFPSEGVGLTFPSGGTISFPAGGSIIVTPAGQQAGFNLNPADGTISFPGSERPPFPIKDLTDSGIGLSFPAGTVVSFPGQVKTMLKFPVGITIRLRKKKLNPTRDHPDR